MNRVLAGVVLAAGVCVLPSVVVAQGAAVAVGDAMVAPVTKDYAGADPKELFAAVEQSYKKAGIPVTERDPIGLSLGNSSFVADKKIFNLTLDKIFDCGGDKKVPAATRADLVLSIVTKLVRVDDVLQLRSSLTATGTVMSESGPVSASCVSLGALEKRLQPDPMTLKCGSGTTTFATTVITVQRGTSSGGPSVSLKGPPTNCTQSSNRPS